MQMNAENDSKTSTTAARLSKQHVKSRAQLKKRDVKILEKFTWVLLPLKGAVGFSLKISFLIYTWITEARAIALELVIVIVHKVEFNEFGLRSFLLPASCK